MEIKRIFLIVLILVSFGAIEVQANVKDAQTALLKAKSEAADAESYAYKATLIASVPASQYQARKAAEAAAHAQSSIQEAIDSLDQKS